MATPYIPLAARFWAKVQKTAGCWLWMAGKDHDGYGQIKLSRRDAPKRINTHAHRIAWQLTYGPVPAGLLVCHHCDNPGCVRPDHLFLDTPRGNMRDRDAKRRHAHGVSHGMAKLDEADVRVIRAQAAGGVSQLVLAGQYGVGRRAINNIVRRKSWQHL